jgi:hypothetical protein
MPLCLIKHHAFKTWKLLRAKRERMIKNDEVGRMWKESLQACYNDIPRVYSFLIFLEHIFGLTVL